MARLLSLLALAMLPGPALAADVNAGQVQAASCAGCHGLDGRTAPNPMAPALAGQRYDYLVKQIRDFRSGRRQSPVMNAMVATMTDTNIEHVATWYASLEIPIRDGPTDARGETLYLEGDLEAGIVACRICHGVDATGVAGAGPRGFPALRGQTVTYTSNQLLAFADEQRTNDLGHMMMNIARKLSEEDRMAVARYLAHLPPLEAPAVEVPATSEPEP